MGMSNAGLLKHSHVVPPKTREPRQHDGAVIGDQAHGLRDAGTAGLPTALSKPHWRPAVSEECGIPEARSTAPLDALETL